MNTSKRSPSPAPHPDDMDKNKVRPQPPLPQPLVSDPDFRLPGQHLIDLIPPVVQGSQPSPSPGVPRPSEQMEKEGVVRAFKEGVVSKGTTYVQVLSKEDPPLLLFESKLGSARAEYRQHVFIPEDMKIVIWFYRDGEVFGENKSGTAHSLLRFTPRKQSETPVAEEPKLSDDDYEVSQAPALDFVATVRDMLQQEVAQVQPPSSEDEVGEEEGDDSPHGHTHEVFETNEDARRLMAEERLRQSGQIDPPSLPSINIELAALLDKAPSTNFEGDSQIVDSDLGKGKQPQDKSPEDLTWGEDLTDDEKKHK